MVRHFKTKTQNIEEIGRIINAKNKVSPLAKEPKNSERLQDVAKKRISNSWVRDAVPQTEKTGSKLVKVRLFF